jgi:hypothetical protein
VETSPTLDESRNGLAAIVTTVLLRRRLTARKFDVSQEFTPSVSCLSFSFPWLFDLGTGRYIAPPREDDAAALPAWKADLRKVGEDSAAPFIAMKGTEQEDRSHVQLYG